jgi:hypothetical protein
MDKLLVVILIYSSAAIAENWFAVGKSGASTTYAEKAVCESAEKAVCWEVSNCESDECSIGDVDDLSSPIIRKDNVVACADKEDCALKLGAQVCSEGQALINADFTEVYCAVTTGYAKKKAVVQDPLKKKDKDDRKSAEEAKRAARLAALKACVKQQNPTVDKLSVCISAIVEELGKDK